MFQCYVDFREAWQMDWVVASLQREAARKRTMALLKFVGVGSGEAARQHPELLGAFMAGGISDPAVLFCSNLRFLMILRTVLEFQYPFPIGWCQIGTGPVRMAA